MRILGKALSILVILFAFRHWFLANEIIGGDWPYFRSDLLREFSFFVPSWMAYQINGFGGPSLSYALDSYLYAISYIFVHILSVPWSVVYKVAYFGLFLVLSYASARYLLSRVLASASSWQRDIASLVYTTNTFILMVAGGGQLGIALAYAVAPFVLGASIELVNVMVVGERRQLVRQVIAVGLLYAVIVLFDARIAYLVLGAHALYILITNGRSARLMVKSSFFSVVLPWFITFLLHASWILPMIVFQFSPYQYVLTKSTSLGSLSFFSFADFSNAVALLHPNWPENIFGKVYFLRPEFLILPLVGFSSLFFISNIKYQISNRHSKYQKDKNLPISPSPYPPILFFALLALLGVFLAKGTKEPFGELNAWMFANVPGFSVFRDPTKFYLYVILGYVVLIPTGLSSMATIVAKRLKSLKPETVLMVVLGVFLCVWVFTIRDAFVGRLGGTLRVREVPREYVELANELSSQPDFFRTLWYPRQQRFAYYTNLHPPVEANHFFGATVSTELAVRMSAPDAAQKIQSAAIKYVIVPYDSEGEIFTDDRKYDDKQWQQAVATLDSLPWLTKKERMGKIVLYEVSSPFGRFQLIRSGVMVDRNVAYTAQGTTRYALQASGPSELIFSERFDPSWAASLEHTFIPSNRTKEGYNSFSLPSGTYAVDVYFDQEYVYTYGRWLSFSTLVVLAGVWIVLRRKIHTWT